MRGREAQDDRPAGRATRPTRCNLQGYKPEPMAFPTLPAMAAACCASILWIAEDE